MRVDIANMLSRIRKPYRLAGGERGCCVKDWDSTNVRICLAFPEIYDIGMSNLGLAILYDIVNARGDMLAERVFALWADAEEELRRRNLPLFSLESQRAVKDFDIIGISLPYELTYTNVLQLIDLAGLPLRASDRTDEHPLIIGGGPCAFNPEPIAAFFDAFVLGDGEQAIVEIANCVREYKSGTYSRDELFGVLSNIRGVYIPHQWCAETASGSGSMGVSAGAAPRVFFSSAIIGRRKNGRGQSQPALNCGVRKAIVSDLNDAPFPHTPVVAHAAVQDRAGIEIQRGCVRGCRFCQAGMVYRPMRQRSPSRVNELVSSQLERGGHTDLSLLSLSVGDYACLEDVLAKVGERWEHTHLNVSLPSLRTESLTGEVLKQLGNDRAGSFTLAPEAATERMRRFINKGNTDEDLYASVEKVFKNGWSKIKLYFMVGLPGETEEEIQGIVTMANRCLDIGRMYHRRPDVTVSTSTFIPKPHTPLQWAAQISVDEALEIQRRLKKELRRPGLYYRWHRAEMSLLEGVFSRGGRELADAVEAAHRLGARFDGWDECVDMDRWQHVFVDIGIDVQSYRRARTRDEIFPWDHLFVDLSRDFLWREYEKALHGEFTQSCADGPCAACGVCDFDEIRNRAFDRSIVPSCNGEREKQKAIELLNDRTIVRLRFSKHGRAIYLGHLELMDALRRIVRRAGLPIAYTEGYHPRPRISLGRALPVGMASDCEYADMVFSGELDGIDLLERLNAAAPDGIAFHQIASLDEAAPAIDQCIVASSYEVHLPDATNADECIDAFHRATSLTINVMRKKRHKDIDVKAAVTNLAVIRDSVVGLTIAQREPAVKIPEVIGAIFGIKDNDLYQLKIRKVDIRFREN